MTCSTSPLHGGPNSIALTPPFFASHALLHYNATCTYLQLGNIPSSSVSPTVAPRLTTRSFAAPMAMFLMRLHKPTLGRLIVPVYRTVHSFIPFLLVQLPQKDHCHTLLSWKKRRTHHDWWHRTHDPLRPLVARRQTLRPPSPQRGWHWRLPQSRSQHLCTDCVTQRVRSRTTTDASFPCALGPQFMLIFEVISRGR